MAIEVGTAYISILPETSKFASALSKTTASQGTRAGKEFGGAMNKGLGGMAKKVFAPLAAAAGAVAVGGWAKDAISQASSVDESLNALRVTYGQNADAVIKMGQAAATSLGLSSLEFNELSVRFSNFTKTIAGPGGDVVGTLEDLTGRATDFASVMNLDVAEAAELFQSGLAGETEPLRRYGIDMSAAAVEAYALSHGIADSAASMTEAQKVQARYALLMEQTAAMQGDFKNTSGGLANQLRILSGQWSNVTAKLGSAFLPAAAKSVQFITGKIMPALDRFATGVQGLSQLTFEGNFTDSLSQAFGWEEDSPVVGAILSIREAFTSGGLIAGAQEGFAQLGAWLRSGGVATIVSSMAESRDRMLQIGLDLFQSITQGAVQALPLLTSTVLGIVRSLVPTILSTVPQILNAGVQLLGGLVRAVGQIIGPLVNAVMSLVGPLIQTILRLIPSLIQAGITLFLSLVRAVTTALPQIIGTLSRLLPNIIKTVLGLVPQLLNAGMRAFSALIDAVLTVLPQLLTTILGTLLPRTIQTILQMLPRLLTAGIQVFLALVDAVITILPRLIDTLYAVVIPQVIRTVLKLLPQLLKTAIQVFMALVTGLLRVLPQLIGTIVTKVIPSILRTIGRLVGQFADIGWDMLVAMGRGIRDAVGKVGDALGWLRDHTIKPLMDTIKKTFRKGIDAIGDIWNDLKALARKPVEFVVNTVYNKGIRKVINFIPGVPDLPAVHFARGGPVRGGIPGKDSVLSLLMPGEHVFTEEEVRKAGGHFAIERLRQLIRDGAFTRGALLHNRGDIGWPYPKFANGGTLSPEQIKRAQDFAKREVGKPYIWGGVGPAGYDCSGFMSAITNVLLGQYPYSRRGTSATFPWSGFHPGWGQFTVGSFTGSPGHMAGTLAGLNVESTNGSVRVGSAARGASNPMFTRRAHLGAAGREAASEGGLFAGIVDGIKGMIDTVKGFVRELATMGGWAGMMRQMIDGIWEKLAGFLNKMIPIWNPVPTKLFDSGGVLGPGMLAVNGSSRPEAVFTQPQLRRLVESRAPASVTPARFDLHLDKQSQVTLRGYVRDISTDAYRAERGYASTLQRMGR